METSEAPGIVLASRDVVGSNVLLLLAWGAKTLESFDDLLVAALLTHLLGGEVGVAASTVPVSWDGLGVERDDDSELLANTLKNVARHPEVVAGVDSGAGANLVLPLARHDLTVDTGDGDAGEHACGVVSLHNGAAEGVLGADRAIVRSLGARLSALGPPEGGLAITLEEGVLLLNAEPWHSLLELVEQLGGGSASVGRDGSSEAFWAVDVGQVSGAHDEDVRGTTEGIVENSAWL